MTVTSVSCAGLCEGASLRLRPISRLGVPCCSSGRSQRCAGSGGRAGHRRPAIRAVLVVLEHVVAEVDAGLGLVGEPVTLGTEDEKGRAGTLTHEERRAMAGRYGDRSAPPGVVHALEGAPSMGRPRLPGAPDGAPSIPWCFWPRSLLWSKPPQASITQATANLAAREFGVAALTLHQRVIGPPHAAPGHGGGAAPLSGAFQQEDPMARICGAHGCRQSRGT